MLHPGILHEGLIEIAFVGLLGVSGPSLVTVHFNEPTNIFVAMKNKSKSFFDNYNGNLIWTSVLKDPLTKRWVFLAQVLWGDDGEFKSFPSQLSYATQTEAKLEALSLAKLWISAGKPAVV